jgi:opacity protein-like surface antigen
MRKLLLTAALLLALPMIALAQDEAPKVEIFGGYSYLRLDDDFTGLDRDLNGFNTSFTTNLNKWFGITAEFSGHYGTANIAGVNTDFDTYIFAVGPRVAYRGIERITPYGHVLVGAARSSLDFGNVVGSVSGSGFALVVGGGVDLKLTDNIALRLFQADYVLTRIDNITNSATSGFNTQNQNNFRASTGVVVRLGEQ